MADYKKPKKEVKLKDCLTDAQKNLVSQLTEIAPNLVNAYIPNPIEKISEYDIDEAVRELDSSDEVDERKFKGYLWAVFYARKNPPKKASPLLNKTQQTLIGILYCQRKDFVETYFEKSLTEITEKDIKNVKNKLETIIKTDKTQRKSAAFMYGYLQAIQNAGKKFEKAQPKNKDEIPGEKGLLDTSLDDSAKLEEDANIYDDPVEKMDWPSDEVLPYEKDGRTESDDHTPVYEAPESTTKLVLSTNSKKDVADLVEINKEYFQLIVNAIKKEPKKYINTTTGEFLNPTLADHTIDTLDAIKSTEPDFETKIDIPGYKVIRAIDLYNSARKCSKKETKKS